jgi:GNAT superfamily N-acetyltransferase
MNPAIREYAPDDLERCRELWRALVDRHREIYDDPTIGGADPGLELDEHLRHPRLSKLSVAESDGRIIGLCGLLVDGKESELEPIVVDPDHRNRGVGALLAAAAISESRRRGFKYINVQPVGRNLEAIRFFHREGFQILGHLALSLQLDGNASPVWKQTEVHGLTFEF